MPRMRVIGLDHVYLAVRDLAVSEPFYDRVLGETLGFRKLRAPIGGDEHVHYYNRHYGISIRPARAGTPAHDPYAPGLHHVCLRVGTPDAVDRVVAALRAHGIAASAGAIYPEYAPDYHATFFADPDGIRLEVTNFRAVRKARMFAWDPPPAPVPFDDVERAYLVSQPLGRLATVSLAGQPDVVPVGFELDGQQIVIGSRDMPATRKYRNVLAGNPRVSFVVDDLASVRPWKPRGVHVTGAAVLVERTGRLGAGWYVVVTPERHRSWGLDGDG
jgi:glyoxylase I family protein